jgi:hypothetical protein
MEWLKGYLQSKRRDYLRFIRHSLTLGDARVWDELKSRLVWERAYTVLYVALPTSHPQIFIVVVEVCGVIDYDHGADRNGVREQRDLRW